MTLDETAETVSRGDQILGRERGQGNIHFPCSADDWQSYYPVDTYFCYMYDHAYYIIGGIFSMPTSYQ